MNLGSKNFGYKILGKKNLDQEYWNHWEKLTRQRKEEDDPYINYYMDTIPINKIFTLDPVPTYKICAEVTLTMDEICTVGTVTTFFFI